jgi:hypothetical protein
MNGYVPESVVGVFKVATGRKTTVHVRCVMDFDRRISMNGFQQKTSVCPNCLRTAPLDGAGMPAGFCGRCGQLGPTNNVNGQIGHTPTNKHQY